MADGETLRAKYGTPTRLVDREVNVLVFRHASEESARAFAAANNADEEHSSTVEEQGGDWLTVVDLRPALAQIDAQFQEAHSG